MEFKDSAKSDIKIKASFDGLSGSGKTLSALLMLKGLLSKISDLGVIQSERGRAQLYLDKIGQFKILELEPPFNPEKFIEAIVAAEKAGLKAVLIDSISDEWAGPGGCLDIHQAACEVTKNSFAAWKGVSPRHEALFQKILSSPLHVFVTTKKKSDYVLDGGKVKKVGLAPVAREGTEYKYMLTFDIDLETHMATVSKDNTNLFKDAKPFLITEETGRALRDWILSK